MRDRYEYPTDPAPWSGMPPVNAAPQPPQHTQIQPQLPPAGRYQDYATRYDEPAGEARAAGLKRLSKLTWRATQLSAVAAVGFAALFAHAAHATTVSGTAPAKPSTKPSATPTPSPSATKKKHHPPRAAAASPAAATGGSTSGSTGTSTGSSGSGGSTPAPTLAPPTTAPAPPPPSPAPTQTTSSGSGGG